ncbi:MAG: metal ABC transporter substrate-binding protein [Myxococcota bacterium]
MLGISLILSLVIGCGGQPAPSPEPLEEPEPASRIEIRTASFPADWLVDRLAGDLALRENILPPGEDAPFWQPSGEQVAALAAADLIVVNGAGFEGWLKTATLPEAKVIESASLTELIELKGKTHSHGKAGEHSHASIDPHTWSDPLGYAQQAGVVHEALVRVMPEHEAVLDTNLGRVTEDLQALHNELEAALAPSAGVPLSASHPAFNYLARRYTLDLTSFDFDPEEVPNAKAVAAWSSWADGKPSPILLWEGPPTDAVKGAFPASTRHIWVDPLEQPREGRYDYLVQARGNVDTFRKLFSGQHSTQ